MGIMKMGNTTPRLKATSLAFRARVLPLHHVWHNYYSHTHLLMQPLVSADYYNHAPRIVSLLMHTITYRQWPFIDIHRVGSTTIQCIACTGSWSRQPMLWVWWKWEHYAQSGSQTHIFDILGQCATITPCRLPYVTTIPTPIGICSSLLQRSVQTATIS